MEEKEEAKKMPRFIRVTKANKHRDRGIIAVDAICSAFEDEEKHIVLVMTMDGFWYEVEDSIEDIYAKIDGLEAKMPQSDSGKVGYMRKKRFSSATIDRAPVDHEKEVCGRDEPQRTSQTEKPKPYVSKYAAKKQKRLNWFGKKKDFPSGEGEGRKDDKPVAEGSTIGTGEII